jgi:hypothetical protein
MWVYPLEIERVSVTRHAPLLRWIKGFSGRLRQGWIAAEPAGDPLPASAQGLSAKKETHVPARLRRHFHIGRRRADKAGDGKELVGGDDLVVPGSEQEQWCPNIAEVDWTAERGKPPLGDLVLLEQPADDLQIKSARQIERAGVPLAIALLEFAQRCACETGQDLKNTIGFIGRMRACP